MGHEDQLCLLAHPTQPTPAHPAPPYHPYTATDRQNFGHTNCGCIDGATVYGSQGPALSPRPPNPNPHNPSTLPTLHRSAARRRAAVATRLVLYSAFALWPCPWHSRLAVHYL